MQLTELASLIGAVEGAAGGLALWLQLQNMREKVKIEALAGWVDEQGGTLFFDSTALTKRDQFNRSISVPNSLHSQLGNIIPPDELAFPAIRIRNTSSFPVYIEEVGFCAQEKKCAIPRKRFPLTLFSDVMTGKQKIDFPYKLESMASVLLRGDRFAVEVARCYPAPYCYILLSSGKIVAENADIIVSFITEGIIE